jgi:Flp pilus assembly protein TadB
VTYCEGVTRRPGIPGRRAERVPVYQITGARRGVRDDVDSRTRRYLVSMGIRTVCFVLAVVTHGWLRWAMIFLALTLPYLSLVFANGGRERIEQMPDPDVTKDPPSIDGSSG